MYLFKSVSLSVCLSYRLSVPIYLCISLTFCMYMYIVQYMYLLRALSLSVCLSVFVDGFANCLLVSRSLTL